MATTQNLAHQPEQASEQIRTAVVDRLIYCHRIPTRAARAEVYDALDAYCASGWFVDRIEAMANSPETHPDDVADEISLAIDAVLPIDTPRPEFVNRSQLLQYLVEFSGEVEARPEIPGVADEVHRINLWRPWSPRTSAARVRDRHAVYAEALTVDPGPHATVEIPRPVAEVLAWAAVAHEPDRFACEESGQSRTTTTALPLWWRDVLDDLPRGWAAIKPPAWAHALEVLTQLWGTEL